MVQQAARRLGRRIACGGPRGDRDDRLIRLLVGIDYPERLVTGVQHLDRAHDDAAIRIVAGWRKAGLARRLLGERRETVEVQAVARERPAQVGATPANVGMQRCRVFDVHFLEMVVIGRRQDIEPVVGDDAALVEGVFLGMP